MMLVLLSRYFFSKIGDRVRIAGETVHLFKNDYEAAGVTFLLTGAQIPLTEYKSIIEILLMQNQLVVGIHINLLSIKSNQRKKAQKIKEMFDVLKNDYPFLPNKYYIVGHSVGAQVALLVASSYDKERVSVILALDPIDLLETSFTNKDEQNELDVTLVDLPTKIVMTLTDCGDGFSDEHNAVAITKRNPNASISLVRHQNAGHMAYTDNGGGLFGKRGGTSEGNDYAKNDVKRLILELIQ